MGKAQAADRANNKTVRWIRKEAMPLLVMLVLLTAARASFANHYQVPSGSMEPTLMPGDRVMVDMMAYGLRIPFTDYDVIARGQPEKGDIVVFKSPADGVRLIKRVAAVGGDTVALIDGRLWVNGVSRSTGEHADMERLGTRSVTLNLRDGGGPDIASTTIPDGMVLVLGDHRGNSADGRYFGLVPASKFYGKAVAVYYRRGEGLTWQRL